MKHPRLLVFVFSAFCLVVLVPLASAQTDQIYDTYTISIDWEATPADYPCLVEAIHLTGTFRESMHVIFTPSGGYSWQWKQGGSPLDLTAVGETTGAVYRFSGPLSGVENGSTDDPWVTWYPLEWTFHNINHFVGPAGLQNVYIRTLEHVTLDMETGELKVEFAKDDVICR